MRKAACPISSAKTPPGTEGDERPEDRVLDDPGEKLGTAADERLDQNGKADSLRCLANLRLRLETDGDAARLGLVRARHRALDDCGQPKLDRRRHSLGCRLGHLLGNDGDAVGVEQRPGLGWLEPCLFATLEGGGNDRAGSVAVDSFEQPESNRRGDAAIPPALPRFPELDRRTPDTRSS